MECRTRPRVVARHERDFAPHLSRKWASSGHSPVASQPSTSADLKYRVVPQTASGQRPRARLDPPPDHLRADPTGPSRGKKRHMAGPGRQRAGHTKATPPGSGGAEQPWPIPRIPIAPVAVSNRGVLPEISSSLPHQITASPTRRRDFQIRREAVRGRAGRLATRRRRLGPGGWPARIAACRAVVKAGVSRTARRARTRPSSASTRATRSWAWRSGISSGAGGTPRSARGTRHQRYGAAWDQGSVAPKREQRTIARRRPPGPIRPGPGAGPPPGGR